LDYDDIKEEGICRIGKEGIRRTRMAEEATIGGGE